MTERHMDHSGDDLRSAGPGPTARGLRLLADLADAGLAPEVQISVSADPGPGSAHISLHYLGTHFRSAAGAVEVWSALTAVPAGTWSTGGDLSWRSRRLVGPSDHPYFIEWLGVRWEIVEIAAVDGDEQGPVTGHAYPPERIAEIVAAVTSRSADAALTQCVCGHLYTVHDLRPTKQGLLVRTQCSVAGLMGRPCGCAAYTAYTGPERTTW